MEADYKTLFYAAFSFLLGSFAGALFVKFLLK